MRCPSRRIAATAKSGTSGYTAIRWYQQSRHGGKWATSDRYRLPAVATDATSRASRSAWGRTSSSTRAARLRIEGPAAAPTRSTAPPTTLAWAPTASMARNRVTVETSIGGTILSGGIR